MDRYLDDDRGQRTRMALFTGAVAAASGTGASVLGLLSTAGGFLAGWHGIALGGALGLAAGIGGGLYACKRFIAPTGNLTGGDSFMTPYLLGTIGVFGSLACAASAVAGGVPHAAVATAALGVIAALAGGAARSGASRAIAREVEETGKNLDRATEVEGIVVRNARNTAKAPQQIEKADDYVIIGGVRVRKQKGTP
jgi:hypothetical protein